MSLGRSGPGVRSRFLETPCAGVDGKPAAEPKRCRKETAPSLGRAAVGGRRDTKPSSMIATAWT